MKTVITIVNGILLVCLLLSTITQAQQTSTTFSDSYENEKCYAQVTVAKQFVLQKDSLLIREGYTRLINHPATYDTIAMGVLAHAETKVILNGIYDFEIIGEPLKVYSDVKLIPLKNEFEIRDVIKEDIIETWNLSDVGMCDSPVKDCDLLDWIEIPVNYIAAIEDKGKAITKDNKLNTSVAQFHIRVEGIEELIPVEYKFYAKEILAQNPKQEIVEIAPIFKTNTTRVAIQNNIQTQMIEVVCPSKVDGFLIGQVQLALKGRKYYFGRINGVWTDIMQTSLENYQINNELPIGKLDKNTVENLGLNYEMIVNPSISYTLTSNN